MMIDGSDDGFNVEVVPDSEVEPETKARMMRVNAALAGAQLTTVMTILVSLLVHAVELMADSDDELTGDMIIDRITGGLRSAWLLHESKGKTKQ